MIRHRVVAALLCASMPVAIADASTQPTSRAGSTSPGSNTAPATPVERRLREYLSLAGGTPTPAHTLRYINESFTPEALGSVGADDRLEDVMIFRQELGSFALVRVDTQSPVKASAVLRSGLSGRLREVSVEVEPNAPHRIVAIGPVRTLTKQTASPRTDVERARMLDAFATRLAAAQYFAGTVLLARDGKVIFSKAYGLAERRFAVPNSLDTRFHLGSITKPFTAVGIAQLVEQGKVSWDDPLGKFLPGFPNDDAATRIRIKHLLTHTSGLTNTPYPPGPRIPTRNPSVAQMVAAAPKNALMWEPGTKYLYNNLGYLLLGRIIEIVSGQNYYDYVRDHVFKPAGMQGAGTDRYDIVDRLSYGYEPLPSFGPVQFVDGRLYIAGRAVPFGGAYGTALDVLRFDEALRSGALVQPSTFRLMTTAKPELAAPRNGYGFSLGTSDWAVGEGRKTLGHGGNTAGVCTEWRRIEDADARYTFVILSNSGQRACFPIAEYILDLIPAKK